jgi:hypothetical protein
MIGLAMMLAATPTMTADARADLKCAVATAWSMSRQAEGSTARLVDTASNMFYMGRLSGRDGTTNWFLAVLNEGKQNRQTDAQYSADFIACGKRLTQLINGDIIAGLEALK